jgi:hypothetical protein
MGRGKVDELSRCYDFGFLPESREMSLITRHQVVRARRIGTLEEYVVVRIACNLQTSGWNNNIAVVLDELEQLLTEALANAKFRPGKHSVILRENGPRNVKASRFSDRQQKDRALKARRLKSGGNQDICIDYQTERKHYRFDFRDREVLMIRSI